MKSAQTRPSNLWRWLVLGLCLLSFGKGVWDLGEQSLWWDESLSHYRATRSFGFILSNRMTFINGDLVVPITPDNHPPLYFVLLRLVLLAAGESEFALRFLALAMGVLLSTQAYLAADLKEDHRGWGHYLSQHVRPDDPVLINPGASAQLYFYHVDSPDCWYGFPLLDAGPKATLEQIGELAANNDRLWIAQSMTPHWANPGDLAREWLRENAMRLEGARFYSANTTVLAGLFQLEPALLDTLPGDAHPVPLDFGERLSLLGTRATSDAVVTGEMLQLSLYWSALEPLDQARHMTVSLKDDRGRTWLQMDRAPYSGAYPNGTGLDEPALSARDRTSGRLQGLIVPVTEVQVIADPYRIPVSADAPAVPVELRVGMYDRHTMLRFPVYDADGQIGGDHVALTELEVTHP